MDGQVYKLLERDRGFVVVRWGNIVIMGMYFSPYRPVQEFDAFLGTLSGVRSLGVFSVGPRRFKCALGCDDEHER